MYIPRNTKHNKQQKGNKPHYVLKPRGIDACSFGRICLKAVTPGKITMNQLLAAKNTLNKLLDKKGLLFVTLAFDTPITKKPIAIRMGKGKGLFDHWVCKVSPGQTIFEIESKTSLLPVAKRSLEVIRIKFPILTRVV